MLCFFYFQIISVIMKRKQILLFSLSFLLLLTCLPANAQLKQGFKALKKRDYENAEALFQQSAQNPTEAPIAGMGLRRAKEAQMKKDKPGQNNLDSILNDYRNVSALFRAYEALPEKSRDRYAKNKWVRTKKGDYTNALKSLRQKAFKRIEGNRSLPELDSCVSVMGPFVGAELQAYHTLEEVVVRHNFYSTDYLTLLSIVHKHNRVLELAGLNPYALRFSARILEAFLNDYPLYEFRTFTEDLPRHWISQDCQIEAFLEAVKTKQVQPIAELLDRNRSSNLDIVALYALAQPHNQVFFERQSGGAPDSYATSQFDTVSKILIYGFGEDIPSADVVSTTRRFVQETSPSNRAYLFLIQGLKHLKTQGAWRESSELLRFSRPFFLSSAIARDSACIQNPMFKTGIAAWFDSVEKLLETPYDSFRISNLGLPSTIGDEFSPLVSQDDTKLRFNREWASENFAKDGDILLSFFVDSAWIKPIPDTVMNKIGNSALHSVTAYDDQWTYSQDKVLAFHGIPHPAALAKVLSTFQWVGKTSLSPNGQALIFESSDDLVPIDNDADIDLYVTTFDEVKQTWRVARKMSVNTFYKERTPFIHADNKTLLFSSDGLNGFGGTDIYKAQRLDDTWLNWSQPENLGKEVNGYDNDGDYSFSAPAHGRSLYYSDKTEDYGSRGDLYQIALPQYAQLPRVVLLQGTMSFSTPNLYMRAITDLSKDTLDTNEGRVQRNRKFTLPVIDEGQDSIYYFIDEPEYYSTFIPLCLKTASDVQPIEEMPYTVKIIDLIKKELPIPSDALQFEKGSAELSPSAQRELAWLARYFKFNRQTVLVAGHCGIEEGGKDKDALSLARAEAVKAFLISKGMRWDRIWTQGFADKKPLLQSLIPIHPPHERRVEIYIKTQ